MPQIMKPNTCQPGAACNLDEGMAESVGQHRSPVGMSEYQAIFCYGNTQDLCIGLHALSMYP